VALLALVLTVSSLCGVYAADGYASAQTTNFDVAGSPKWTLNRFGDEVPILQPPPNSDGAGPGAPALHLHYLALRGLADLPALILEAADLPYRATYYGKADFVANQKAKFEFGRLPVLVVEGVEVSQSGSIVRLLARKGGLAGGSEAEEARADSLFETWKDIFVSHGVWGRAFDIDALKAGSKQTPRDAMLHLRETSNRGDYTAFQKAAVALKTFEELLVASSSGFLVGGNMTYVDLALWQKLHELGQPDNMGDGWADQLQVPVLGKFATRIGSNPKVAAFVHSGRRMQRIKRVDGDYVYQPEVLDPQPTLLQLSSREL